jgi:hypothetical protein
MDKWDVVVLTGLIIVVLGYVEIAITGASGSNLPVLTVLGGFSVLFGTAMMAYGTWKSLTERRKSKAKRSV